MAATAANPTGSLVSDTFHALNEDIYFLILPLLSRQADISALMRTCWTLYTLSAKPLLQMGASIRTDKQLVSFCHFMHRHLPGCARHFTRLSICIPRLRVDNETASESDLEDWPLLEGAPLLARVVHQFIYLDTLALDFCEELLECDARLGSALSTLPAVQSLRVTSFGLRSYDVVNTIRSPLVHAHVDGNFPSSWINDGSASETLPDPLEMLSRHQATLTKVFLAFFDVTEEYVQPGPSTSIFPRVSALALVHCRVRERAVLVDAFPHLRVLEITGLQQEDGADWQDADDMPDVDAIHHLNRGVLRSWPELDHVYGDLDTVYMLALRYPVRRLDMICKLTDDDLARMQTVIGDVLPTRLVVRCGFPKFLRPSFDPGVEHHYLADLLNPGPATDSITHFGLDLGLRGISGEPIYYQRSIVKLLSRLKVRLFAFRMHATDAEYEPEHGPPQAEDLPILRKFGGKFLSFWATRIAEAVPTLEFLAFRVWDKEVHWRIARAVHGAPLFTRIDVDAGRAFVQEEGMQWYQGAKHAPAGVDSSSQAKFPWVVYDHP